MCGIFILLYRCKIDIDKLKRLFDLIDCRGPDYSSPLTQHVSECRLQLALKASVLHLRGDIMQKQPVIDNDGNVLMFNGQIYKYLGKQLDSKKSDTLHLAETLNLCTSSRQIADVFTQIEGPFAFVYWHNRLNLLIYGRDLFGRKSLCALGSGSDPVPIIISSTADENLESNDLKWTEVSCSGFHCIDFTSTEKPKAYTFIWNIDEIYPKTNKCRVDYLQSHDDEIITTQYLSALNDDLRPREDFTDDMEQLAIEILEEKFIEAVLSRFRFNNTTCLKCRRSSRIEPCCHAKVAVAFSGGIDSTLIALALDKIIDKSETIDLITVAFKTESPDRVSVGCAFRELKKLCPSRNWRLILCDIPVLELQQERDEHIRNLILPCDSVFDDGIGCACWFVGRATGRAIDTTASQEWFAKHFETFLRYDPSLERNEYPNVYAYTSPASMLFVGSSIDEQLGGYSSHRAAWSRLGNKGLHEEISFLMRRLSSRNLGRDDRVYCHHGRDLKLPFLDFQFVSFLNQLPIGLKMNLGEPLETGPKKILRQLAFKWGLVETGKRVKRAMQFGTRIANLENSREKGNDVCPRLRQNGLLNQVDP